MTQDPPLPDGAERTQNHMEGDSKNVVQVGAVQGDVTVHGSREPALPGWVKDCMPVAEAVG